MLTPIERVLFLLAALISLSLTALAARRIVRTIGRGQGRPELDQLGRRLFAAIAKFVSFAPTFSVRRWTSVFHALVGWGLTFYLLVDLVDVTEAFLGGEPVGNLFRLAADVLSVGVLVGMAYLIVRRFLVRPRFVGSSFVLASEGGNVWMPFASALSQAWAGWSEAALVAAIHVCFW